MLEIKRADDARHVRELETRLNEAESFVSLRPKLQAKLQSLQTELTTTKRELADAQQLAQLADGRILDSQEQLEMVTLDKEMAEERAELAEADLEEMKERLAVMEVELQVLREGHGMSQTYWLSRFSLNGVQATKKGPKRKPSTHLLIFNWKSKTRGLRKLCSSKVPAMIVLSEVVYVVFF